MRRPFKVKAQLETHGYDLAYPNHSDPRNFVLGWEQWDDFPFRGVDLVEGRDRKKRDGLGPPDSIGIVQGESVRNAFLLTDSFRPVDTAHAQRYAGKEAMEAARAAAEGVGYTDEHYEVIQWLALRLKQPDCPATLSTDTIALKVTPGSRKVGHLLNGIFGDVDGVRNSRGQWRTDLMRKTIDERFEVEA